MPSTLSRCAVAIALILATAAATRAEDKMRPLELLMERHPAINLDTVTDIVLGLRSRPLDGLLEDQAKLETMHGLMMARWRAIQRARWTHFQLTQQVAFQSAAYTLALFNVENERRAKLASIEERQNAEFRKRYSGRIHSKKDAEEAGRDFERTPEYRQYQEERLAVQKWFMGALEEEKQKARTGQTPAMDKLDELTADAHTEAQAVGRARRFVAREIEKRRSQKSAEPDEPRPPTAEELEERRVEMHLAPIRTEYEAKTGEVVEAMFQVWRGKEPYAVYSRVRGSLETLREQFVHDPGEFTVLFSFRKPGTYTANVHATDRVGTDKQVTVTITVTGDPITDAKTPDDKGGGGDTKGGTTQPTGESAPGVAIIPFHGTYQAMIWGANAGLNRWDWVDHFGKVPTPITLTVAPDGTLSAKVRYVLPASEMRPMPAKLDVGPSTAFWKTSFDLSGKVDWNTGKVSISIANGHDERGYERDRYKTDNKGAKTGIFGHWRDWTKVDYTTVLEGWTIPGPQSAAWISRIPKPLLAQLAAADLEGVAGAPALVVGADGAGAFRDRGFFGAQDFGGNVAPPDGTTPRRHKVSLRLQHSGYDGMNEKEENETAKDQARADKESADRLGGWYLKILGLASAEATTTPAFQPKDDDVLGFGLWPVKPITLPAGSHMSARAMGVLGKDVNEAVDLSAKATWSASPGLVLLKDGSFSAPKPGTYTLTATMPTPNGPMTSTIQVIVTDKR